MTAEAQIKKKQEECNKKIAKTLEEYNMVLMPMPQLIARKDGTFGIVANISLIPKPSPIAKP